MKNILITIAFLLTYVNASSITSMQEACEKKVAVACYHFAILNEQGSGLKQDKVKAKEYYLKACEYGYDEACKNFEIIKTED